MPRTSRDTETGPSTTTAKVQRERDQALAMQEYEAEQRAVRANMARLRELRLAREARVTPETTTKATTNEPPKAVADRPAGDRPARRKNASARRAPVTRARSATGRTKRG